jgi:L-cystine transport system permease protein
VFKSSFPKILAKFPVTLEIVVVATVIGLLLGLLLAFMRIKKIPVLCQLAGIYISYIRGVPVLVQLFIVYYGLPMILRSYGIDTSHINKIIFVFVTYGLNQAGFMAEIIRASILSVPVGQTEAGYSVGLTEFQTFQRIVLPQAIKVAIPNLETMFIMLFKSTALAYMVGIIDMMGKVSALAVINFRTLEGYLCVVIIFAAVSLFLEHLFEWINKKLRYGNTI